MKKLALLFHTLLCLKPAQLAFFIWRRNFPSKVIGDNSSVKISPDIRLSDPLAVDGGFVDLNTFEYLNRRHTFPVSIDWSCQGMPRLWAYNLHYFDYLRNGSVDSEARLQLVQHWIERNVQGSQPGWEPFTASLRIVNWVFYLHKHSNKANQKCLDSLYTQVLWLEKNDERHILANHYFENLKALLFAGVFFSGSDAGRWRKRAVNELTCQFVEQTLDDGGHYERSPQYHCLMLESYLDIYNLISNNTGLFEYEFIQQVEKVVASSLCWLRDIVFPDQNIPLFNDSAFGIAPTLNQLDAYATRLLGYSVDKSSAQSQLIEKAETGLYGVRHYENMLIMDCGDIGPSYQPGHTHCDFLSYELMIDGQRVIVDTGVSEYAPGARRQYLRSTAAHNTVSINGLEQSEAWGEFRVARRAKKLGAAILNSGENIKISGAYAGFFDSLFRLKPSFQHARQINVKLVKERIEFIDVVDTLSAFKERFNSQYKTVAAKSYIHFHPDIEVQASEMENGYLLKSDGRICARVVIDSGTVGSLHTSLNDSIYCPEFGKTYNNKCLEISVQGELPTTFGYRLEFI